MNLRRLTYLAAVLLTAILFPQPLDAAPEKGDSVMPDTSRRHDIPTPFPSVIKERSDSLAAENPDSARQARFADDLYSLAKVSQAHDDMEKTNPNRNWWYLLRNGRLDLKDPSVEYPRFLRFCVNVYNWGDQFFNGTDTAYVAGTGRRWKARVVSDNWADSYAMNFSHNMSMRMMSDVYCNAGIYLQYMAVSLGYSIDLSNVIGNKPSNHKKLSFGFSCARFSIEAYYQENTGGTYMRKFGKYHNGEIFKRSFPGLTLYTYGLDAYYFFNNRRYSQGAAYNFSKYQRRSQGSWIAGFSYANIDTSLDFSQLPLDLKPFFTMSNDKYCFHYDSYCLMGGYGFNWVWSPHMLFNITTMPAIGIAHCYEDSVEGAGIMLSMGIRAKSSITYNLGDFFICGMASINGHWYNSRNYSFFSSIENFSLSAGVRF